jgi:hypothetical protein
MLLLIECGLVILALVFALLFPRLGERWFQPIERSLARLARRRALSVVVVGGATLLIRVLLLPILPIPEPAVHDEFSYLLAADTFAHGRLANPTHPMWVHFETFHVNQKPTYVSMYYPAQGLFLALGQVVFGHPFWGVWLSTGLMCGAICWMLQGWLPPFWALIGGLLALIRLGTFSYWMNSYWGGSVAALGGALVLGALPRIKRHPRLRDALLMGIGFAIVANSRPYEGLFFAVPVLVALLLWMRRPAAPPLRVLIPKVIAPLLVLFVMTLAAMGYYFWRTTGSPLHTPFTVNVATYAPAPYFPWQEMKSPPSYHHVVMRDFYLNWWRPQYALGRTHPVVMVLLKASLFWLFFVGPLFTALLATALLTLPWGASVIKFTGETRFLSWTILSVMLGALLPVYFNAHYAAPITAAFYALLMISLRKIRRWRPNNTPAGIALARYAIVASVLLCVLRITAPSFAMTKAPELATWYSPFVADSYREGIVAQLKKEPGHHLVIVHYDLRHPPIDEWVYNGADIDKSRIVWARDMGPDKNAELIRYFKDRKVWVVEPDVLPPKLSPYVAGQDEIKMTSSAAQQRGAR